MDAVVGVWFTSLLGAGAFSVAGYVLGQRGVVIPLLRLPAPEPAPEPPPPASVPTPVPGEPEAAAVTAPELPPVVETASERMRAASAVTVPPPPPQAASLRALADLEATKTELREALEQADAASARAAEAEARAAEATAKIDEANARVRAAEAARSELERQLASLRNEVRQEVAARATASARADELADRLAGASSDAASLRHKVSQLDKERRQLREALQGRVRALTESEWHRRRDLEEAEGMRVKLRDLYDKIEKTSLPPGMTSSTPPVSLPPLPAPRLTPPPTSNRRETALLAEVDRLTVENRELRAKALGESSAKKARSRDSVPEVDLDLYRVLLEKVGAVAGIRAAIVGDELGSLLVGTGELAEGLAAFGAYIRDASLRTERLLPLDGVFEVDIRDRAGVSLCTRVVATEPHELSLVMLGAAPASIVSAKRIAEDTLRQR